MNTNELLDSVKEHTNIKSERALARLLGMTPQALVHVRERGLSDERCVQVAKILDYPPMKVLAWVHAERSKDAEVKEIWSAVAETIRVKGVKVLTAAFVAVNFIHAIPGKQANAENLPSAAFKTDIGQRDIMLNN